MEQFQKIEALTGQRMEKFDCEEAAALLLLERVTESQKLATMQVLAGTLPAACQCCFCGAFDTATEMQAQCPLCRVEGARFCYCWCSAAVLVWLSLGMHARR